uniref:Serine/threonine-protein kinase D1-3-like ubiquitin-like domain-containing protein n=1 Tax=Timema douglasi TaxID=61478 RepID=A0A7R8Z5Z1_TIMDO|nr:unnamed protein product [Timema douglasi]
MEGPEVTFLFQFGLVRDTVTTVTNTLGLKTIKSLACDFINKKHCGEEGTVSSVLQLPGRPCRVNDLAFTFHLTSPGPTSLSSAVVGGYTVLAARVWSNALSTIRPRRCGAVWIH